MRVLLVHVDGKMPNLALMKISAWHKRRGDSVELRKIVKDCLGLPHPDPDVIYVSCIFSWNRNKVLRIPKIFPDAEIHMGGTGVGFEPTLPDEIEHILPDYDLYDVDYSLGFTSRGCPRNCPWCFVPRKEGMIRDHAPISEFLDPRHHKLILLDNNFLASPKWKENLNEILDRELKVCFTQGLDIRLINQENAKLLAETHYYNWKFRERRLYFAFDTPNMERAVRKGVATLKDAGIPPKHLMFYFLCGFYEPYRFDMDYQRFQILNELGVDPFVMIYNNRKDIRILRYFAQWVNLRIYKKGVPWLKYDHRDSQRWIKSMCACVGGGVN